MLFFALTACGGGGGSGPTPPVPPPPPAPVADHVLDLRDLGEGDLLRATGSGTAGDGIFGVPVAGGFDIDGDGNQDFARANMIDTFSGRIRAGSVQLVFGNGALAPDVDLAADESNVLSILGDGNREATGGEIWMSDLTGDGIGELIVGRPNYRAADPDRIGAGAVSILVGSPVLRDLARDGLPLDLRAPPASVSVLTITGAAALDRFGFWMRNGDVSGDGIDDIVIGADQEDSGGASNSGAAYVIRGGPHINNSHAIDLADFGASALAGHIFRILPPPASERFHFGATVALMDLDGNGRSEVLVAASLNRAGGALLAEDAGPGTAEGSGANPGGSVFILWDDNIPAAASWPAGLSFTMGELPMSYTRIDGGTVAGVFSNRRFGEEIIGGRDYDGDGNADVFFGDITGQALGRVTAGTGHLFFNGAGLRNRSFSMSDVPADLALTTFLGPEFDAISSDTATDGDFDGDDFADLAIGSPKANPLGRVSAGIIHVIWGRPQPWPELVDLRTNLVPDPADLQITEIAGANGDRPGSDDGDTLMYSASSADINQDGRDDLVVNEMLGNGVAPGTLDVGNLIVISGAALPKPQ